MPFITKYGAVLLTLLLAGCTSAGLAALNLPPKLQGGYKTHHAVYGPDAAHKADIYVPDDGRAVKRDVIVFYYGGRWQSGKKADYRFIGAALARRGFITVIPDFRKYPQVRFPVFVDDAAKALAWVDDNIARYGGRRDRIHLAGHSSGAHMAALLAADETYLRREGKDAHELIRDFAGLAGPYDFVPEDADLKDMFGPPENYPAMQVTSFIDGREPPMLLQYGLRDDSVKPYNHQRLAERITRKGGKVEVLTYSGLGHVGIVTTFSALGPSTLVVDDMVRFFANGNGDD